MAVTEAPSDQPASNVLAELVDKIAADPGFREALQIEPELALDTAGIDRDELRRVTIHPTERQDIHE